MNICRERWDICTIYEEMYIRRWSLVGRPQGVGFNFFLVLVIRSTNIIAKQAIFFIKIHSKQPFVPWWQFIVQHMVFICQNTLTQQNSTNLKWGLKSIKWWEGHFLNFMWKDEWYGVWWVVVMAMTLLYVWL